MKFLATYATVVLNVVNMSGRKENATQKRKRKKTNAFRVEEHIDADRDISAATDQMESAGAMIASSSLIWKSRLAETKLTEMLI